MIKEYLDKHIIKLLNLDNSDLLKTLEEFRCLNFKLKNI